MNTADRVSRSLRLWILNDEYLLSELAELADTYHSDSEAAGVYWDQVLEPLLYPDGQNPLTSDLLPCFAEVEQLLQELIADHRDTAELLELLEPVD